MTEEEEVLETGDPIFLPEDHQSTSNNISTKIKLLLTNYYCLAPEVVASAHKITIFMKEKEILM